MSYYTFQRVFIVVFLSVASSNCNHSENLDLAFFNLSLSGQLCEELLMHYARLSANFTQCFIQNARPITVCKECIDNYVQVIESHENITELKDEDTQEACKLELINVDRLEVIEANFDYVKQQWQRALCDRCFVQNTTELNRDTIKIFDYHNKLDACIYKHDNAKAISDSNSDICVNCTKDYELLNNFYDSHGSYNGFCMDVIDMMNMTRHNWSLVLHCCTDRRKPESLYFVVYPSLLLIPVIFYVVIWYSSTSILQENRRPSHGRGSPSEVST